MLVHRTKERRREEEKRDRGERERETVNLEHVRTELCNITALSRRRDGQETAEEENVRYACPCLIICFDHML